MIKKCTKCLKEKDIEEFGIQKRGLYGRRSVCKNCVSEYNTKYSAKRWMNDASYRDKRIQDSIEWTKNNPEKRAIIAKRRNLKEKENNPNKIKARQLVNQRVRFGRMPKASDCLCRCGQPAAHYHHHMGYDFDHRYDVKPLCIKCHRKEDKITS